MSAYPTYRIRGAGQSDLGDVIGLRRYAEGWLASAGIEQWTSSETGERVISAQIETGSTYVVEDPSGRVVGSLALDDGDPDFWTPEELNDPALYLYKFILGPESRGSGLGDVLLDWACYQAELGWALWLRLDCRRDNPGLHRYYSQRGFTHLDTRTAPGRQTGALFERAAELRTARQPAVELIDGTAGDCVFARPVRRATA